MKTAFYLMQILHHKKTGAGTAPFTVANWDESMEKHQHQSHPKNTFFIFTFFLQIKCQFNLHFRYG